MTAAAHANRIIAARIRARRQELGWTLDDLSQQLERLGRPQSIAVLSRIERAERRIDVDDVVFIADVLGLPLEMFLDVPDQPRVVTDPVEPQPVTDAVEPQPASQQPVTALCFVDVETTGLDPLLHEVWEVACISAEHDPDAGLMTVTDVVHVDIPVTLANADGTSLRIGGFYGRRHLGRLPDVSRPPAHAAAEQIALAVADRHMVGVNPAFDAAFLGALLRRHGQAPAWHYHLIDLIALAAGVKQIPPPWKSTDLAETFGVTVADDERHTALGDARWALRWYAAIYGLEVVGDVA